MYLHKYTAEDINTHRKKLHAVYTKHMATMLKIKQEAAIVQANTEVIVIPDSEDSDSDLDDSLSFPTVKCMCGVENNSLKKKCSACKGRLWTKINKFGQKYHIRQKCTFCRGNKTGLPDDGYVVAIDDKGLMATVKVCY